MSILKKSKLNALTVVIMLITILFGTVTISAADFETTIVSINPSNQTVSPEETFTILILQIKLFLQKKPSLLMSIAFQVNRLSHLNSNYHLTLHFSKLTQLQKGISLMVILLFSILVL
jgi:hypothetical protein